MEIKKEKTRFHNYVFDYEFDISILNFCRKLKKKYGWKNFSFIYKKWRFNDPLIIDDILKEYPETKIEEEIKVDYEKAKLEEKQKEIRKKEIERIKKKKDSDINIKGIKGKLFPYQKVAVEFFQKNNGKAILGDTMGLGKTLESLAYVANEGFLKTLVVCPASVKSSWRNETKKWTNLKPFIIDSKTGISFKDIEENNIFIINYDIVAKFTTTLNSINFDCMIVDELHLIKNSSAKRTKAIKQLSKGIPSILLLSGTPILNRPVEIFNSLQMIDPKTWDNWWSFVKRYCNAHQGRFGWDVSGATNIEELKQRISTYFLRRTKEEVLPDLPQKHFIDFPVEMPQENAYQYQVLLNSFIKYLKEIKQKKGKEIMKTMRAEHLAKLNELRQLTSISKIEPAKELIQNIINNDEKVLIFSNYKNSLYALYEEFKKNAVIITGDISNQEREKAIESFQNDPNTKIFLGGIKSAGVGITLTSGNNVVFIDHSWVPADHSQAIDRVHRIGQKANQVTIYQLYCDGTIDEKMKGILEEKQNIFDKIFENNIQEEESSTIDTLVRELEEEN